LLEQQNHHPPTSVPQEGTREQGTLAQESPKREFLSQEQSETLAQESASQASLKWKRLRTGLPQASSVVALAQEPEE
jgi:hypothetical protein